MNNFTEQEWEEAMDIFNDIARNTEGHDSAVYKSSNGYEFVIWIDGDFIPAPDHELIDWWTEQDGDSVKFEMTLPYLAEATDE